MSQKKKILNFQKIWELQALPPELEVIFSELAPKIYQALKASQPPHLSAVPQWAKRKGCWDTIKKEFDFQIDEDLLEAVLTTKELEKEGQRGAKKVQKQLNQEVVWSAMYRIKPLAWQSITEFCENHKIWGSLMPNQQRDIKRLAGLSSAEQRTKYITEQEAENLFPIFAQLNNFGFDFHAHDIPRELWM